MFNVGRKVYVSHRERSLCLTSGEKYMISSGKKAKILAGENFLINSGKKALFFGA